MRRSPETIRLAAQPSGLPSTKINVRQADINFRHEPSVVKRRRIQSADDERIARGGGFSDALPTEDDSAAFDPISELPADIEFNGLDLAKYLAREHSADALSEPNAVVAIDPLTVYTLAEVTDEDAPDYGLPEGGYRIFDSAKPRSLRRLK